MPALSPARDASLGASDRAPRSTAPLDTRPPGVLPPRRWRAATALLCGLAGATPLAQALELLRVPAPAAAALRVQCVAAVAWYLASGPVARRWSLADSSDCAPGSLGVLAAAVAALGAAAALAALGPPSPYGPVASWAVIALAWLPTHAATAGLLSFVGSWTDGRWRRAQADAREAALRAAAVEAELAALRARLEPHFLLNALNTIAGLARGGDGERAGAVTADLGDLLRFALAESADAVPFDAEREIVERYVAIEQARLGERLVVTWDLDPAARTAALPALVWQPLVENAVRHGIARRQAPGRLALAARREDGDAGARLRLTVDADGPESGVTPDAPDAADAADAELFGGLGVGLRTTERRLALLYGGRASVALYPRPGGSHVELVLPLGGPDRPVASARTVGGAA